MITARPALTDRSVRALVAQFLAEDVGRGDLTTLATVSPTARLRGVIVAREELVVAGQYVARAVFAELDEEAVLEPLVTEGEVVRRGTAVARVTGPARPILTGERVALNLLQRLSGIATVTRQYVEAIRGYRAQIVDTRKTTPGLRLLEKYAVTVGGGRNHRLGLDDGVLVKDNHIAAAGSLGRAIEAARTRLAHMHRIEVEVDTLRDLQEALNLGVDAVLLDNMTPEATREAVACVRERSRGGAILVESSGGITLRTVRAYAEAGVDLISVGALTHSAPAVDLGLDLEPTIPVPDDRISQAP